MQANTPFFAHSLVRPQANTFVAWAFQTDGVVYGKKIRPTFYAAAAGNRDAAGDLTRTYSLLIYLDR